MSQLGVRRGKAALSSGCETHPATAPAGSNRSSHGARPIEGDWPYLWIDATYVKVRQNGRIVSVAVIVAVAVNSDGRREVLGMDIGPSEAETFWTGFLRKLARRGLRGVKLRRLRRSRGDQGSGLQSAQRDLAPLPRALHAQTPWLMPGEVQRTKVGGRDPTTGSRP